MDRHEDENKTKTELERALGKCISRRRKCIFAREDFLNVILVRHLTDLHDRVSIIIRTVLIAVCFLVALKYS